MSSGTTTKSEVITTCFNEDVVYGFWDHPKTLYNPMGIDKENRVKESVTVVTKDRRIKDAGRSLMSCP